MNINRLSILWITIGLALIVSSAITFLVHEQLNQPEVQGVKSFTLHEKSTNNAQKIEIKQKPTSDYLATKSEKLIESAEKNNAPLVQTTALEHVKNTHIEESAYLNEDDIPEESIKNLIAMGIEDDFKDLNLSEEELQVLTEAVISIRASMKGLRYMERSSENTESFIQLHDQLHDAIDDFKEITGMSLTQFMLSAPAYGGLDNDRPDDEEIVFEYLGDRKY
jgi:hypothetical protein